MDAKDKEIARLNNLLGNANRLIQSDKKEAKREAKRDKNYVEGGFYMMSRTAEKNLRELQVGNPTASLIFSVLREYMQIGSNAVTISTNVLCKLLNKSRSTVSRAVAHLSEKNFVQVVKTGTANTYIVNERIAFSGKKGQRKAVFSATVVAHECEQESSALEDIRKLKKVPVVDDDEQFLGIYDEIIEEAAANEPVGDEKLLDEWGNEVADTEIDFRK